MSAPDGGDYDLVLTPPARRAITERLPESIASAVFDFLTTALVAQPKRVGKPLRDGLSGIWSARRGTYRVLYRVLDEPREVVVLRIEQAGRLPAAVRAGASHAAAPTFRATTTTRDILQTPVVGIG